MKAVGAYKGSLGVPGVESIHWSVVITGKTKSNFAGEFIITANGRSRGGVYHDISDILPTFARAILVARESLQAKNVDA